MNFEMSDGDKEKRIIVLAIVLSFILLMRAASCAEKLNVPLQSSPVESAVQ